LARGSQNSAQSSTPDSVRCARLVSGEKAALGKRSAAYDYNSLDCPVSQTVASATVDRAIRGRRVARTNGQQGAPDSVRCAIGPEAATVDCALFGRQSRTEQLQGLSDGAPDCLMHHTTEGKISLPRLSSTAPSCLGAIKGSLRRMKEHKHSLSILRHPDSVPAHSLRCVRDLSSIRVEDSLCCHLSSSLLLCAWVCCDLCLVCCSSQPYFVLSL
jgi:hypothetical protein